MRKHAQQLKWKWAGHMIRTTGERWTKLVTTWKGPKGREAGRPIDRWTDDLRKVAGDNWIQAAGDRAQCWRRPTPERGLDLIILLLILYYYYNLQTSFLYIALNFIVLLS
ncbi:hypothetical protein EVAR_89539_1 [Eumeta japonica]|uniref:Uncharacterized protein n=1 Tax=Eumeta variegata TaxID=151549 RepID=A0A4C1Z7J5_EUMVA|nr:hypothetical protein EVAR_89539_1 [Eumeta japonica]